MESQRSDCAPSDFTSSIMKGGGLEVGVVTAEKQMRSSDEEMGEKMKSEDNKRVFMTVNGRSFASKSAQSASCPRPSAPLISDQYFFSDQY